MSQTIKAKNDLNRQVPGWLWYPQLRSKHVAALIWLALLAMCSCTSTTPATKLAEEITLRQERQEDAVNIALRKNYDLFHDGSSMEQIALNLRTDGLDFMVGHPPSDFAEIFSSAYTLEEYSKLSRTWVPRESMSDWIKEHSACEKIYLLQTNIWKTVGMLEDDKSADTLLIAVNDGVVADYRFFANMLY